MAIPTPTPDLSPDELSELLTAYMPDIPGYRVLRRLGQGGMSYVYLGVQESLDRQVAIKVIAPTALKDEISKLRFEREARTIAKLQHPAIVSIHDVGRSELGLLYFVMPYLPRGHLGERDLREDEPRLLAILRALLWALDYAHERGIVHRDIKSENVLFDNVDRPLLTDFGIAMHRSDRNRVTDGGFALGSATHMAPEQARGERVDARADLYSIGVLAFEKLVGELPFQADGPLPMAVRHAVDPVPRLPPAKAHWQAFIDRAMAKSPDARFASARDMMAALDVIERARAAAAVPAPAAEPETAQAAAGRRGHRRGINPVFVAGAAFVVLALALVVAIQAWTLRDPGAASPKTQGEVVDSASAMSAAAPIPAPVPPAVAALADSASADSTLMNEGADSEGRVAPLDPTGAGPAALVDAAELEAAAAAAAAEAAALAEEAALPPGERALRAAARQITRQRLTQPPGDNALESLLRAQDSAVDADRLARLGEAWLQAAQPHIAAAFAGTGEPPERRLHLAATELSTRLQLREGDAWRGIEQIAVDWLRTRLRMALKAEDLDQLRAYKAEAAPLGVRAGALEPEWSQGIVRARVGDRLADAMPMQLLRVPADARTGLATMPGPVSRADYARFVEATGRADANCRVRSATFNLRKRRWNAPGFEQAASQPVVCVSLADANAYAEWLGQREGQPYRLASEQEWRVHLASAAAACEAEPASCASTRHVREWPASCGPGCERQPVLGFGWREAGADRDARAPTVEPQHGYDDVGFRLVRDVTRAELEQR
jgi:tRNA A-37 threonylcarbamoyl transferase component Bud32